MPSNNDSSSSDSDQPLTVQTHEPADTAPVAHAQRAVNRRSRSGCLTCRRRRIKCDETRPKCHRCEERSAQCEWPPSKTAASRHRHPRALRSCEQCRQRKTKCDGPQGTLGACPSCTEHALECVWPETSTSYTVTPNIGQEEGDLSLAFTQPFGSHNPPAAAGPSRITLQASPLERPSEPLCIREEEMELVAELVRLYFSTVHYFGYLTFVHEAEFWDRFDRRIPPAGLTLLMAANALRFGGRQDAPDRLELADRWASSAGERVLSQAFQEFGAIELMETVLYHHYEFQCGRYSRGWILAGMAVRMMTFLRLPMFDESPHPVYKPLLGAESLRRLAWAVYFLDATIDGGNHGFTAIADGAFTIRLPCDEHAFLRQSPVSSEHMIPLSGVVDMPLASLGLSGHLLRAMHVRQILAGLHSRIQRRLITPTSIATLLQQAEGEALQLLGTLPHDMQYSRTNFHIFKSQQTLFLHLHVLRNTCLRHLALLKILCASFSVGDPNEVSINRQSLIREARQLSTLFSQGVDHGVVLDPQLAMHAYNGIEVLLYQPLRQSPEFIDPGLSRNEISRLLKPLSRVVREIARVSELVALLYPEAVNRLVRMGFTEDLLEEDMIALLRRVHRLANADTEFDFQDSFWRYELALQRHRGDKQMPVSPNDLLLEVQSDTQVAESSLPPDTAMSLSRLHSLQDAIPTPSGPHPGEAGGMPGDVDWQAAFSLPIMDLQTLMGGTDATDQVPFPWSFSGSSL